MAQYQADVWLGSDSGRQRVTVSASSLNGAVEQIRTIYNVNDTAIWNVREVPRRFLANGNADDTGADSSEASLWGGVVLVGLLLVLWVVATFTPEVFAFAGATAAWWLLCRLRGLPFTGPLEPDQRRLLPSTVVACFLAALLLSQIGLHLQRHVFNDAPPRPQPSGLRPQPSGLRPQPSGPRSEPLPPAAENGPSNPLPP